MPTARELQETIERCIAIVVYYQSCDRTGEMDDRRTSEVRSLALSLGALGLSAAEAREMVVEPVRRELLERFGPFDGPAVAQIFADAFDGDDPFDEEWPGDMRLRRVRGQMNGAR
ncbi:hypothetical protein TA3x_000188 [Tundrisphaera sp. TA3]|uniref:hypothetical protein n=1 Tax=Tundrisphaera sp. TA3 TaxID=3435775 RepID=UPI003EBAECED